MFKPIKNTSEYYWTRHAQYKMKQYGLSAQRVVRVIRNPERIEEGIVEKTIAVMQPTSTRIKNGKKIWSQEIWAMYQTRIPKAEVRMPKKIHNSEFIIRNYANQQIRIISAWRYPGMSPKNNPIPEEILNELQSVI
jgi:hypothetical protein